MRMILVHGINQQGKDSDQIRTEWMSALQAAFAAHGPDPLGRITGIEAAFYGDKLEQLSSVHVSSQAIALGAAQATNEFNAFAYPALEEMALKLGATPEQLSQAKQDEPTALGDGPHKRWVKAIAKVIEDISPFHGTIALRLLGQAHAYIRNKHAHDEVNKLVRPLFDDDEPAIIISHSLGTVVSYSLLREFARDGRPRQCPLWMTFGSPLGIDSIRKGFAPPRTRPLNVGRWFNGADPEDFVALHPVLSGANFGSGVENYPDFENGKSNPHDILKYLRDTRVAPAIAQAIP